MDECLCGDLAVEPLLSFIGLEFKVHSTDQSNQKSPSTLAPTTHFGCFQAPEQEVEANGTSPGAHKKTTLVKAAAVLLQAVTAERRGLPGPATPCTQRNAWGH